MVICDHLEDRIHDVYEEEMGSLSVYASHDLTNGEAIASAFSVNINLVLSSPDGRPLAGVDSRGNLTLFELESLRTLYCIRLDTTILPEGLAFTSNNLCL